MPRRASPARPGRVRLFVERTVLGALMATAAFLVERRLRRALEKSSEPAEPESTVEIR